MKSDTVRVVLAKAVEGADRVTINRPGGRQFVGVLKVDQLLLCFPSEYTVGTVIGVRGRSRHGVAKVDECHLNQMDGSSTSSLAERHAGLGLHKLF